MLVEEVFCETLILLPAVTDAEDVWSDLRYIV